MSKPDLSELSQHINISRWIHDKWSLTIFYFKTLDSSRSIVRFCRNVNETSCASVLVSLSLLNTFDIPVVFSKAQRISLLSLLSTSEGGGAISCEISRVASADCGWRSPLVFAEVGRSCGRHRHWGGECDQGWLARPAIIKITHDSCSSHAFKTVLLPLHIIIFRSSQQQRSLYL